MAEKFWMWIRCNLCGTETSVDFNDCSCENCGGFDWSEPYS